MPKVTPEPDWMVAPFTGARIETGNSAELDDAGGVAPFTGARIETASVAPDRHCQHRRALHGRADRNNLDAGALVVVTGRALHGRADRNFDARET